MSNKPVSKLIAELQRKHYDEWPDAQACETPLLDLLHAIPLDARMVYEEPDGMGHHMIPVGRLAKRAFDRIAELKAENERLADGFACPVCGGHPKPDDNCACGGSGHIHDAYDYLRGEHIKANALLDEVAAEVLVAKELDRSGVRLSVLQAILEKRKE